METNDRVTGRYYGIPFSGTIESTSDDYPATLHGQPAGRRCYVLLDHPISVGSYPQERISAWAHELKLSCTAP